MRTSISSFLCGILLICCIGEAFGQCSLNPLLKKDDKTGVRQGLLDKLNSLKPELRNVGFKHVFDGKTYEMKICPDKSTVKDFSGFDETEKVDKRSLGRINESDAFISPYGDLITLIYTNGDDYNNACNKSERRALILIRPDPAMNLTEPSLVRTNEAVGMDEDFCFYLFELLVPENFGIGSVLNYNYHHSVSTDSPKSKASTIQEPPTPSPPKPGPVASTNSASDSTVPHSLGAGSIILILVLVPVLLFFAVGSLYKRFVVGAQGWEQVPFIDFWRRCGSLQSDGWRYVFGRGRGRGGSHYDDYTAVNADEERQPALDPRNNNNDDHLLPM
jgi:hypothetical protein